MIGAIDIGGTKIAVGFVTRAGQVIMKEVFPTEAKSGPENSINRLITWFKEKENNHGYKIEGVGVGSTGPVYPQIGEIGELDFLPGWKGFNIIEMLSKKLHVSVALENDADAAALGEWSWGNGRNSDRFVLVTVGTGIGGGIIIQGKIYRGVNYSHPEIGHHFIDSSGPKCTCGGNGCWESLASGPAMEHWFTQNNPDNLSLTAKEICRKARIGVPSALSAVNRTAEYLALGIANIISFLCPDTIVLTGGLMASSDLFIPTIHQELTTICNYVPVNLVNLIVAHPDANVGVRGAACVYLQSENQP